MSAIATLRTAVSAVLTTVEWRTLGVLEVTENAAGMFLVAVTDAVKTATVQIVGIAFGLARTVVAEAFNVADSVVDAALGEVQDDDEVKREGD